MAAVTLFNKPKSAEKPAQIPAPAHSTGWAGSGHNPREQAGQGTGVGPEIEVGRALAQPQPQRQQEKAIPRCLQRRHRQHVPSLVPPAWAWHCHRGAEGLPSKGEVQGSAGREGKQTHIMHRMEEQREGGRNGEVDGWREGWMDGWMECLAPPAVSVGFKPCLWLAGFLSRTLYMHTNKMTTMAKHKMGSAAVRNFLVHTRKVESSQEN